MSAPTYTEAEQALTPETAFVIWSHRHAMYWGANASGYVRSLAYAGVYSEADARRYEAQSQQGLPQHRSEAIPLSLAQGERAPLKRGTVVHLLTVGRAYL